MKFGGYGGFRERFERGERLVLKNDGERMKKFRYIWGRGRARPCRYRHGRAATGTGRANLLECGVGVGM